MARPIRLLEALHYTTKHNEADTFRVMKRGAEATGKRHRMIDEKGNLLDLVSPLFPYRGNLFSGSVLVIWQQRIGSSVLLLP